MKRKTMLEMSQWLMQSSIEPEFICVDATMGNGHDTHFLSSLCHHVYAFDIQEQALKETEKLLSLNQVKNVTLIHDSH